jgi:hypothetical protein
VKRFALIIVTTGILSGCTSVVTDSLESAPEWFQSRKDELSGQGYPSIQEATKLNGKTGLAPWDKISADLAASRADMEESAPGPVNVTEAEMRAWAAAQRRLVAKGEEPY